MGTGIPGIENLSEESAKLYETIYGEPDMPCVLVGVAYLDAILKTLLGDFLIESSITDNILGSNGVLGTLRSRTDLAYCVGLIPKSLYQNLCTMGEIRNQFAHSRNSLSLEDQDVVEKIDELSFPNVTQAVTPEGTEYDSGFFSSRLSDPRERFKLITVLMVNRLLLIGSSVKRRPRETNGWS
jgi:DNA-binding MltR family transcriptional regulator